MPSAPLHPCVTPGCSALVAHGRCQAHTVQQERQRGSRIARGYDKDWLRLRASFMAQPENQLCRLCLEEGRVTRARECDHIVPFNGLHDPRRLQASNLQPICIDHHRAKTQQQQRDRGGL